ncbi:MAG: ribbon-helix-helix protein, CopG family [Schwartzia sp.]|nr:ribbon-helix-helix protein, CopG family [Schwartzia sp. (in: firmicutes)]
MKSAKNQTVRFRVDKDTKAILDSKVMASGMTVSEFMRQIIHNGAVNPISNGKEIVRQVAMFHEDMLNYHNDMAARVQSLQNAVEENNALLRQANELVHSPVIQETIVAQRERMFSALDLLMDCYKEKERTTEEAVHQCLATANVGKGL